MKLRSAELGMLRESAPDSDAIEAELKDAEKRAAEGDPAVAAAAAELKRTTGLRDGARKQLDVEQNRQREFELLSQRQQGEQKKHDEAAGAVVDLSAMVKERTQQLALLKKLTPEAGKLKEAERTAAIWDGLADDLVELETLVAELAAVPYDAKEADKERKNDEELTEERTKLLADRPEFAARVTAAKARADALRDVEKAGSADEAKQAVKDLEGELRRVREELAVARADLAHDSAHVDDVAKGGPRTPCPVCKKPYGEEYGEILDGYRNRIAANEALAPKLEEKCQRLEKRLEKARETHDDARAAAKRLAETEGPADAATARDEIVALEHDLGSIDKRLRELTTEIPALSEKCKADEGRRQELARVEHRTRQFQRLRRVEPSISVNNNVTTPDGTTTTQQSRAASPNGRGRMWKRF